jgi:hypothetical protein
MASAEGCGGKSKVGGVGSVRIEGHDPKGKLGRLQPSSHRERTTGGWLSKQAHPWRHRQARRGSGSATCGRGSPSGPESREGACQRTGCGPRPHRGGPTGERRNQSEGYRGPPQRAWCQPPARHRLGDGFVFRHPFRSQRLRAKMPAGRDAFKYRAWRAVVKTTLISYSNDRYFQERLEDTLKTIPEVVDIKFSTSSSQSPNGIVVIYSALIIWKE